MRRPTRIPRAGDVTLGADHVVMIWGSHDDDNRVVQILHGQGCPLGQCDLTESDWWHDDIVELDEGVHYVATEVVAGGWLGTEMSDWDGAFHRFASWPMADDLAPPERSEHT